MIIQDDHAYFKHLLELQALVASASTRFINVSVDDCDAEIVSCLGSIAAFLEAEMAGVNMLGRPEGFLKGRYYWVAPHVHPPKPDEHGGDDLSNYPWTFNRLKNDECVYVSSIDSLPADAAEERQAYTFGGLKTVFHIPIFKDKNLLGMICFFTMTKPLYLDGEMIRLLRMLGEIFASLYARREAEKAVADSERHYREMADLVPVAIYEMTRRGHLTYINRKCFELFGYSPADLRQGLSALDMIAPIDRERGAASLSTLSSTDGSAYAYEAQRKDGTTFPVLVYSIPITREGEVTGIRGAVVDLTEQRKAQEKLMASLQEKEILLKEIHHRVKNNMQLVTSLFHLQISQINDPRVKEILHVTRNRMKSIALVHEQFYRSSDFSNVDILPFLHTLGVQLKCTYPREKIDFSVKGADLCMDMQKAIPFGIIANEIISNAFRHGFGEEEEGLVFVDVESMHPGGWVISMGDNGKGLPACLDLKSPSTLGLRLIRDLAEQIDAELTIQGERGTVYTLRLPARS